jgi:hypothetical protein
MRPRVEERVHHNAQAQQPDRHEDQEDANLPLIHAAIHPATYAASRTAIYATPGHVRLRCVCLITVCNQIGQSELRRRFFPHLGGMAQQDVRLKVEQVARLVAA